LECQRAQDPEEARGQRYSSAGGKGPRPHSRRSPAEGDAHWHFVPQEPEGSCQEEINSQLRQKALAAPHAGRGQAPLPWSPPDQGGLRNNTSAAVGHGGKGPFRMPPGPVTPPAGGGERATEAAAVQHVAALAEVLLTQLARRPCRSTPAFPRTKPSDHGVQAGREAR